MKAFTDILSMFQEIKHASQIKVGRNFNDFFADRIIQAAAEPSVIAAAERLTRMVDADVSRIHHKAVTDFMAAAQAPEASAVLAWIRRHPRVAAMMVALPADEFYGAAETIAIDATPEASGTASMAGAYEIQVAIECLSPLAHGGDARAGNATLFRRCQVLSTTGAVLELPFYGGNAWRGMIRDLLADHFLSALGMIPRRDNPPVSLWFFHALYAGGALEEGGKSKIDDALGKNGVIKADGIYQFRAMLPALSLLGCAIGNRVLPGRAYFGDLRPRCIQWGSGDVDAAAVMEWTFLTRREDHEAHNVGEHHGMIANTETLKTGTWLDGGVDIDIHCSDLERAALGRGLMLLMASGRLGAENRRGLGRIRMEIGNCPDTALYDQYLADHQGEIIDYLESIGAAHARRGTDF